MQTSQISQYLNQYEKEPAPQEQSENFTLSSQDVKNNPQKPHEQVHDIKDHPSKKEAQLHEEGSQQYQKDSNAASKLKDASKTVSHSPDRNQLNYNTYSPEGKKHKKVEHQPIHSDEQERQGKGYQELTMKLETALNKIASSKKGLNQTASHSNTIWRRAEECAQKKKKDLERKREESQQMKSKQIRTKPTINKNSERLAKQVGYEPIYNRYEKLLEAKQKKNKEIEQIKKRQKEQEEANFMEELNRHMRRPETVRTYDDYFEEMVKWKERTNKQNREKMELQKSKELEGVTFKPTLNPKSKKMVSSQTRLPIDQRGLVKGQTKTQYPLRPGMTRGYGK